MQALGKYSWKGCPIKKKGTVTSLKLAKLIAEFATDKKAEDIVIYDMREIANFCDFFVLCTGNSSRQVRGIADGIDEGLEEKDIKISYRQGRKACRWILLDLGNVVVHVFDHETREFYGLDHLWQEAKKVRWQKEPQGPDDK